MSHPLAKQIAACLVAAAWGVSCSSPSQTAPSEPAVEPEVDNRPDLGQKFPGWCTKKIDQGGDGTVDETKTKKKLTAEELEEQAEKDDDVHWLLEPRLTNLGWADPVFDDDGREIGRHKLEAVRGDETKVEGSIYVHALDEQSRPRATFRFEYRGPKEDLPEISALAESISYDSNAGAWRVSDTKLEFERVILFGYAADTRAIIEEAAWAPTSQEEPIPDLATILDRVGYDAPHTLHMTGGAWSPAPEMPEAWRTPLESVSVREVDDKARITRYRIYLKYSFQDVEGSGLQLRQAGDWTYDAEGRVERRRLDTSGLFGRTTLADGVYDEALVYEYEHGHPVTEKTMHPTFRGDVERTRIPREWRSVEVASAAAEVDPFREDLITSQQTDSLFGRSGNLIEQRTREHLARVDYRYDGDELVETRTDGGLSKQFGRYRRFDFDGAPESVVRVEYDEQGRKAKSVETVHSAVDRFYRDTTTFTYGDDGKLRHAEVERYRKRLDKESGPKPLSRTEYQYDPAGRLSKRRVQTEEHGEADYVDSFEYDKDGRQTKRTRAFEGGRPSTVLTYEYDAEGNLSVERELRGDKLVTRTEHSYDEAGMRVESTVWRAPRATRGRARKTEGLQMWYSASYVYDEAGRLSAERHHSPVEVVTFGYECYTEPDAGIADEQTPGAADEVAEDDATQRDETTRRTKRKRRTE